MPGTRRLVNCSQSLGRYSLLPEDLFCLKASWILCGKVSGVGVTQRPAALTEMQDCVGRKALHDLHNEVPFSADYRGTDFG
jgi:hypothetical protein